MKPRQATAQSSTSDNIISIQRQHARVLARNVSYGSGSNTDTSQNLDGCWATAVTPGSANTEFAVTHFLGRVPVGFHVTNKDAAGDTYSGTTPWTKTTIYLKCTSTGTTLTLFIF